MMKTPAKKIVLSIAFAGIVLSIWHWSAKNNSANTDENITTTSQKVSMEGAKTAVEQAAAQAQDLANSGKLLGAQASVTKPRVTFAPETKAAIEEFAKLSEKIFPDSDQQLRKSELLMSPEFVQNIGDYLLKASAEEVEDQAREQSIDFLVEALKIGSTDAVAQVEKIIADPQVENTALPLAQRKFLGETKAELIYEFAALNGGKADEKIKALIPGPTTKKIWGHVVQALESNFAESQRDLAETK